VPAPDARAAAGDDLNEQIPYLDRPLLPLALALPRMLREIEAALATAGPGETRRLRRRAELLRGLLLQRTVGPGENPFASSFPANGSGIGD
jgi:hypothetical protein